MRLLESNPAIGPILVGAAIRLFWLDRLSIWLDEAFSIWLARQPIAEILTHGGDIHPPLYYVLLHYWLAIGDSELWARMLSAILGSLTIIATYHLGRLLGSASTGPGAAWLLAVSPWHVWYSQEARMYAAVCLAGSLSVLACVHWLRRGRLYSMAAYFLSTLAGLYLDYTMLLLWSAQLFLLLPLVFRRSTPTRIFTWALMQIVIFVVFSPQLAVLEVQLSHYLSSEPRFMAIGRLGTAAIAVLGATSLVCCLLLFALRMKQEAMRRIVAVATLVVLTFSVVAMDIPGAMTVKRSLVIFAPLLSVAGVWSIQYLPRPAISFKTVLAISVLALLAMIAVLPKEPWRQVVADIHASAGPNDIVLIEANYMTYPFDFYDRGTMVRAGVSPPDLENQLDRRLQQYERAWLVLASSKLVDPGDTVAQWFAARYGLRSSRDYYHIDLRLFDLEMR
ncbi:MAG: glycosyltransferase family 39 protein [Chloroflexi bacterium]|nr:glycosyltransferase family 39 protein [Chloroflexota bacterium]